MGGREMVGGMRSRERGRDRDPERDISGYTSKGVIVLEGDDYVIFSRESLEQSTP